MEKGIIFTAREEKLLIGFALLTKLEKITSFSGTVEDVIVDENYRGKKIGQHLMENLLNKAQELKMEYLDLTSQDKRVAAQNLYKKIGFEKRDTNVFRKLF
ncbi:MAG TPA: GNAT family N-acetyltransferase [Candidatus Moranbacteria bacterium]|nr:GNAT family N-acetyltransferase [Candidatus Moranbacteria bacterium]